MYLCIKPKLDVFYSYVYSATFNAKGKISLLTIYRVSVFTVLV